jgi:hypothetical protein
VERRSHRSTSPVRRRRPADSGAGSGRPGRSRRERSLPPWITLLGSVVFLILCFAFIFFGARSCVATQEATQIRKYITSADSTLSDSENAGNEELESALSDALANSSNPDAEAIDRAADATRKGYQDALRNDEVPPEFEDAHHYLITALGIRAAATESLAEAVRGDREGFEESVSSAVEDYKLSDVIVFDHYVPASERALEEADRMNDRSYLHEPKPFMDYEAVGLSGGSPQSLSSSSASSALEDPSTLRDIEIFGVQVAGRPLPSDGNVILTGSDELVFSVTVTNGGEVAETNVPVEVVLNTRAERQAVPATIERIEPGGNAAVEVRGFKPGEFDETAEASVRIGPVRYERSEEDNTLTGTVTFGI